MSTIYQTIIVALVAAFIILFLNKTDLRNKLRDYCDKLGIAVVADMLDCDFCLSFWTCLCVLGIFFLVMGMEPDFLVIFCAPPITRQLI